MRARHAELKSLLSNRHALAHLPRITEQEGRRRKEVALARLRELEVAKEEGKVIPVQQVVDAWTRTGGRIRDALLSIPDKVGPLTAAATTAIECRDIVRTEIEQILRTLADEFRDGTGGATQKPASNEGEKSVAASANVAGSGKKAARDGKGSKKDGTKPPKRRKKRRDRAKSPVQTGPGVEGS